MTTIAPHIISASKSPFKPELVVGDSDRAREMMIRQKDILRANIEYDSETQLAWQNAQEVHTAFRLNGKLVGTIGTNTGFSSTGITDGGAYQRAQSMADQQGLDGEERNNYIASQVSQALKIRYGADLEVEVFETGKRPTVGEMHTEMFGSPPSTPDTPKFNDNELAYMKFFAQLYSQNFGEDPFEGLAVPYDE
jgi:Ca2+-binding RTX toxin-like protein